MKTLKRNSDSIKDEEEEVHQPKDKSSIRKIQDFTRDYLTRMQKAISQSSGSFQLGKELASNSILSISRDLRAGDISVNKERKSLSLLFPGKNAVEEKMNEITAKPQEKNQKSDVTIDGETMSFRNGTSGATQLINIERKRLNKSYDNSLREDEENESDDHYDPVKKKQQRAAAFIRKLKKETLEHQALLKEMESKAEDRLKRIKGDIETDKLRIEREREEERRKRIIEHIEMLKTAAEVRKKALERSEEETKKMKEMSLEALRNRRKEIKKYSQKKKKAREKILNKIKEIHIPLPLMKIEEHEKKYDGILKKKEEARIKKIEDNEKKLNEMRKSWESRVFEKLLKQKKLEQKAIKMQLKAKKIYQKKIKDFDEIVKAKHRPKFDPVKRLEISIRQGSSKPRKLIPKKFNLHELRDTRSSPDVGLNKQFYEEDPPLTPRSKGNSYLKQGNSKVDMKVLEKLRSLKGEKALLLKNKEFKSEDVEKIDTEIEKIMSQSTRKPRASVPLLPAITQKGTTSPAKNTKLAFSVEISNEELSKMKERETNLKETMKNILQLKNNGLATTIPENKVENEATAQEIKAVHIEADKTGKDFKAELNEIKSEGQDSHMEIKEKIRISTPRSENILPNKKKDYLPEIKKIFRLEKKTDDWTKVLKQEKIPNEEKFTIVKGLADDMDKKARDKQKVWNLKKSYLDEQKKPAFDVGDEETIDDLYFNSIKAKLSLLSDEITEKRSLLFAKYGNPNDKKTRPKPIKIKNRHQQKNN